MPAPFICIDLDQPIPPCCLLHCMSLLLADIVAKVSNRGATIFPPEDKTGRDRRLIWPQAYYPSSRARACRPGRVGENRPRGGRELLSRTGKQTDWEEPPIESKTQLNTQIGGIENSSAMIIF